MIKLKNIIKEKSNDVHCHPAFTEKVDEDIDLPAEQEKYVKFVVDANHNIYIDGKLFFRAKSVVKNGDKTEINYEKVSDKEDIV